MAPLAIHEESRWASVDDFKTGHGGTATFSRQACEKFCAWLVTWWGGGGAAKIQREGMVGNESKKRTGDVDEKSRKISAYFAKT